MKFQLKKLQSSTSNYFFKSTKNFVTKKSNSIAFHYVQEVRRRNFSDCFQIKVFLIKDQKILNDYRSLVCWKFLRNHRFTSSPIFNILKGLILKIGSPHLLKYLEWESLVHWKFPADEWSIIIWNLLALHKNFNKQLFFHMLL